MLFYDYQKFLESKFVSALVMLHVSKESGIRVALHKLAVKSLRAHFSSYSIMYISVCLYQVYYQ